MRVELSSVFPDRGSTLEIRLVELPEVPDAEYAEIVFSYVDEFDDGWAASVGAAVGPNGTAKGLLDTSGLPVDAVFELAAVKLGREDDVLREWSRNTLGEIRFAIREAEEPQPTDAQLRERANELRQLQRERYDSPLGNPGEPGVIEYRALAIVERLLLTSPLRLPGVQVLPSGLGNAASGEAELVSALLSRVGFGSFVQAEWWAKVNSAQRPIALLLFSRVYAGEPASAVELVWRRRDEILDLLALSRGAGGRPLATVLEAPKTGQFRVYAEVDAYRGNLAGGFISGEDQTTLVLWDEAARTDPFLAVALSLLRDAQAESNPDAAYFRFWSLLEVIAGNRIQAKQPVTLLSGSPWIGRDRRLRTTSVAAPRVYELIKRHLVSRQVDEASSVAPASDLREAVTVWYARRNATAHYGAFRPSDPKQQGQRWYGEALKTFQAPSGVDGDAWLSALRRFGVDVVAWELDAVRP
jgi:hypothetical protein